MKSVLPRNSDSPPFPNTQPPAIVFCFNEAFGVRGDSVCLVLRDIFLQIFRGLCDFLVLYKIEKIP